MLTEKTLILVLSVTAIVTAYRHAKAYKARHRLAR